MQATRTPAICATTAPPREGMMAVVRNRRAMITGVGAAVLEPAALPDLHGTRLMAPVELDALVRAAPWSALTPSLPCSGSAEDRPPASPLYSAIHPEAFHLVPVLRAMPRVALVEYPSAASGESLNVAFHAQPPLAPVSA